MSRYLILAQSQVTACALNTWLSLLGEKKLGTSDRRRIVWPRPSSGGAGAVDAYEALVRLIETAARGDYAAVPLNEIVVLVDVVRPAQLSAVTETGDWNHLIAMLILTFPEISWVFGFCGGREHPDWPSIATSHSLSSLFTSPRRDPLLDPTGLRDWVRLKTNDDLAKIDDLQLSRRHKLAAAIEEEKSYAYLHGYTAYRFGCRADVVTTWSLMKAMFQDGTEEPKKSSKCHGYWLLLEDMSLNFPDRKKSVHLLRLKQRSEHCSKLRVENECSRHRILITTGQARPGDTALAENRAYLHRKMNGNGKVVYKPASGIFDLWARSGLFRKRPGIGRKGNVPNFRWPPPPPQLAARVTGHGAPGRLMLVAENLIRRADLLVRSGTTVTEAVQGAVLSIDALEFTGGRTPTTAIEALTLMHRFEVMAECQFSGVEYHIWMQPRLDEIADDTRSICRWFHAGQRKGATLNAEMHILSQLTGILRENNQFDEEQVCMSRVRRLHNSLWMRQSPLRHVFWPVFRYLEILLSSFAMFVTTLFFWVFLLSLLFWWAADHPGWVYGISDAFTSFFSVGGPIHPEGGAVDRVTRWRHVTVIGLAILSGFVHLGVFVSHLYSMTMRK